MDYILEINNLSKTYNKKRALCNVNIKIEKGSFIGMLGENGAGKSTLINIISTNLSYDTGSIKFFEKNLKSNINFIKKEIGIVYQNSILDKSLTVEENLITRASLYNLNKKKIKERINELSQKFYLNDIMNQKYGSLSGGQRRKVDIVRALLSEPSLLILDEPTTGLDPEIRATLWKNIMEIKEKTNMTILLTTHYMEETDNCDYLFILDKGEKILEGTPAFLKRNYSSKKLILDSHNIPAMEKYLKKSGFAYSKNNNIIKVIIKDSFEGANVAYECRHLLSSFEIYNGTIDDMFLKVRNKKEGYKYE